MNAGGYQRYGNFIINKKEPLGSGTYGFVWKGFLLGPNKQLQLVAIKESDRTTKQNMNQIETLKILKHSNIIRYIDQKVSGDKIFLVMEFCDGGTLDDVLYSMQGHNSSQLIDYYSQIVQGIKFMYNKKILHRDLKPQNILLKNNTIKIADFGTSKMNSSTILKTLAGTLLFSSPEMLQLHERQKDTYTEKSQIWVLGLILYYMFNYDRDNPKQKERVRESLPWKCGNEAQMLKNIMSQPLSFKKPDQIPEQIKQILHRMLVVDPEKRMSFEQLFKLQIFQRNPNKSQNTNEITQEKQEERTINEINRQTIDWELQELISLKNNQNTVQEEIEECRQFYQMLINEFSEVYEMKYYELMFELEFQYYKITNRPQQRSRIREKYYQRKDQFHTFEVPNDSQQLEASQQIFVKNQSGMLLSHNPNIESIMPMPGQKLIAECKKFLKDNVPVILQIGSPKKIKAPKMMEFKQLLNTVYDFFTLLTFNKSWEIKRKFKISIPEYKKSRRGVSCDKIIGRIRMAANSVSL